MTEKELLEKKIDYLTHSTWGLILDDIEKHDASINNTDGVNTLEELFHLKGERQALRWFIILKEWYQQALDNEQENR